jgi:hypothetical protein
MAHMPTPHRQLVALRVALLTSPLTQVLICSPLVVEMGREAQNVPGMVWLERMRRKVVIAGT